MSCAAGVSINADDVTVDFGLHRSEVLLGLRDAGSVALKGGFLCVGEFREDVEGEVPGAAEVFLRQDVLDRVARLQLIEIQPDLLNTLRGTGSPSRERPQDITDQTAVVRLSTRQPIPFLKRFVSGTDWTR